MYYPAYYSKFQEDFCLVYYFFVLGMDYVIIINLVANEILFVFGSGYNYVLFSPISTINCEEVFFYIQSGQKNVESRGVLVTQSYSTLCNHMVYNPPGSSVHGILQARILERVAISSSRGSYRLKGLLHCRQILYRLSQQGSPTLTRN